VKFFTKEEHANQFVRGSLFMNRLSYFKRLESEDNDGRPDATEAVATWWQPHDLVMDLNIPGIGAVSITKEDLAGPVSMAFEFHGYFHIFFLCTVYTTGFELVDGKLDIAENDVAELRRQLLIDERWFKFGPYAVVTPVPPFLAQLKEGLRRSGRWFNAGLVEYYNDETFHGEIAPKDIPFRKQKRFAYQKEFRICVHTGTKGNDPITIEIGDISHICVKVASSQLNDLLQLKLEAAPPTLPPSARAT
jgi:hypothetical protein